MDREFSSHISAVETLAAHGIEPPREWRALRQRFADYAAMTTPATDRLAAAVVRGGTTDIVALRAAALAEEAATSVTHAAVADAVRNATYARLCEVYAPHVSRNYRAVSKRFDELASGFTSAAKVLDPEASSEVVLRCDERARQAWFDAAELAEQLDALLPVLCATAELAGAPSSISRLTEDGEPLRLPLACEPRKAHRRQTWDAWNATADRCGRWGALRGLGIVIGAHPHPERLEPYAPPRPFQMTWEPGEHGGYQKVFRDPEDDPQKVLVSADGWEA